MATRCQRVADNGDVEIYCRECAHTKHVRIPKKPPSWWRQPSVIIPIVISLIVAVGGLGAFWEARNQYVEARAALALQVSEDATSLAAAQRQQPVLVSFASGRATRRTETIHNLSQRPIYNTVVALNVKIRQPRRAAAQETAYLYIPYIGPCSVNSFSIGQDKTVLVPLKDAWNPFFRGFISTAIADKWEWAASAVAIQFKDADNLNWQITASDGSPVENVPSFLTSGWGQASYGMPDVSVTSASSYS